MKEKCYCCGGEGRFSILVAAAPDDDDESGERLYLPNQIARDPSEYGPHVIEERWFCQSCMRFVEDTFRAAVKYRRAEKRTR